jgi:malate synthase
MTSHFLRSYSRLLIRTCHRRRVHAMGGMAAQIPIKDDPAANAAALGAVAADKVREATDGHDGTWVAHPGLVPVALPIFEREMPGPNQFDRSPDEEILAADLLAVPTGRITRAGLRTNLRVALEYIAAWLSGNGCVPIAHKMEDAATAEISRTQVWQWIRHRAELEDGTPITRELALSMLDAEAVAIRARVGDVQYREGRFAAARRVTETLVIAEQCPEFLTLPGYELLH